MGITVRDDEALKMLKLLDRIDSGYVPTRDESVYWDRIDSFDLSDNNPGLSYKQEFVLTTPPSPPNPSACSTSPVN